jgi:hypothetical protein
MSNSNSALDAVFEQVASFFSKRLQKEIRITSINPEALNTWQQSWTSISTRTPPNGGWDWRFKLSESSRKYSKRLVSIAVWGKNNYLCGLAICYKSKGNQVLNIHYIEGSPDESHPLKGFVLNIIDTILKEYGGLIKTKKIRILNPVDGLKNFYLSQGYTLSKKSLFGSEYCEKGIEI